METIYEELLGSRPRLRLLRRIYEDPAPRSGRELAREVGFSHTYAIDHLRALEGMGILIRRRIGSANTYAFNDRNYFVKKVLIPLFTVEDDYLKELTSRFKEGLRDDLVRMVLFGSVAKGSDNPRSDVDLALVMKDGSDLDRFQMDTAGIVADATVEFGRPIDALVFEEKEFDERVRDADGMWEDIRSNGIDLLEGKH